MSYARDQLNFTSPQPMTEAHENMDNILETLQVQYENAHGLAQAGNKTATVDLCFQIRAQAHLALYYRLHANQLLCSIGDIRVLNLEEICQESLEICQLLRGDPEDGKDYLAEIEDHAKATLPVLEARRQMEAKVTQVVESPQEFESRICSETPSVKCQRTRKPTSLRRIVITTPKHAKKSWTERLSFAAVKDYWTTMERSLSPSPTHKVKTFRRSQGGYRPMSLKGLENDEVTGARDISGDEDKEEEIHEDWLRLAEEKFD